MRIGNFVFMDKNGEYEINPTKQQMAVVIKQAWDENKQLKKELEKLKESDQKAKDNSKEVAERIISEIKNASGLSLYKEKVIEIIKNIKF